METDYILRAKAYLDSLNNESRADLHKLLVELKRSQEESLFALEKEYLRLVADRRFATISALKANCNDKSFVGQPLKDLQAQTEQELESFVKVRVYEGWQVGQVHRQIERLVSEAAVPKELFEHQNYDLMRKIMQILWEGSK